MCSIRGRADCELLNSINITVALCHILPLNYCSYPREVQTQHCISPWRKELAGFKNSVGEEKSLTEAVARLTNELESTKLQFRETWIGNMLLAQRHKYIQRQTSNGSNQHSQWTCCLTLLLRHRILPRVAPSEQSKAASFS